MTTKWYTLTVRVGIEGPVEPPATDINTIGAPAFALAPGIRDALGIKGPFLIDDVYLLPDGSRDA